MRYEKDSCTGVTDLPYPSQALLDKDAVSSREGLVYNKDIRLNANRGGKRQTRFHPGGVRLEWLINHLAEFTEIDDGINLGLDQIAGHAKTEPTHMDVFSARIIG